VAQHFTADASGCGRCAKVNSGREVPEAAGVFLPRETKSFTPPAPCNPVIYGVVFDVVVVRMQFRQLALEGVGVGGRERSFSEAADI
jgi:hypothetical protein